MQDHLVRSRSLGNDLTTARPVFEKLSNSTEGVNFYSVDVDDQPDVAQECGITAMPVRPRLVRPT